MYFDVLPEEIGVGDFVAYDKYICLVVEHTEDVTVHGSITCKNIATPFLLININGGHMVTAFSNLVDVNQKCRLLLKNADAVITKRHKGPWPCPGN